MFPTRVSISLFFSISHLMRDGWGEGADLMIPIAFVVPAARPPVLALLLRSPLSIPWPLGERDAIEPNQSQRDCALQPRVGSPRATLGNRANRLSTPSGLWPCSPISDATPSGLARLGE